MPCDTVRTAPTQTLEQRGRQIDEALKRLERYLQTGSVRIVVGANGAIAFNGWQDRDAISDVCAYRTLAVQRSWALRQAVARAEAQSGRRVNEKAIAAGYHSHDSGRTWGRD